MVTGLSARWMVSGLMTLPGWDGGSRTEEDLLALLSLFPFPSPCPSVL